MLSSCASALFDGAQNVMRLLEEDCQQFGIDLVAAALRQLDGLRRRNEVGRSRIELAIAWSSCGVLASRCSSIASMALVCSPSAVGEQVGVAFDHRQAALDLVAQRLIVRLLERTEQRVRLALVPGQFCSTLALAASPGSRPRWSRRHQRQRLSAACGGQSSRIIVLAVRRGIDEEADQRQLTGDTFRNRPAAGRSRLRRSI